LFRQAPTDGRREGNQPVKRVRRNEAYLPIPFYLDLDTQYFSTNMPHKAYKDPAINLTTALLVSQVLARKSLCTKWIKLVARWIERCCTDFYSDHIGGVHD
tara:strand:- start:525 stop:827 length:303 start_codon:yes stop_codon:yes gene_type:complete